MMHANDNKTNESTEVQTLGAALGNACVCMSRVHVQPLFICDVMLAAFLHIDW